MSDEPIRATEDAPPSKTMIRGERWGSARGAYRSLLRMAHGDRCACLLLERDAAPRTWTFRLGLFPGAATDLDALAVVEAMSGFPSDVAELERLGYISGKGNALYTLLCRMWQGSSPLTHDGRHVLLPANVMRNAAALGERGYAPRRNGTLHLHLHPLPPGKAARPRTDDGPDPGGCVYSGVHDSSRPTPAVAGDAERDTDFLDAWAAAERLELVETWTPFMDGMFWNNALTAFYSHPGDVGRNRRQAGELYPLLAPLMASDAGIGALVDAGRPYEDAICAALDAWISPGRPSGFTRAKLRLLRLRKPTEDPMPILRLVAALHHDRLRTILDRSDPGLFSDQKALRLHAFAERYGLDMTRLTDDLPRMAYTALRRELDEISDMVTRCAETLVAPSLGDSALDARLAAATLLFGDRTFKAIRETSLLWHARMEPFEAALPEGKDLVTWPALFEPFAWESERIVCLTRVSELRAEGRGIADRDGLQGLNHCVGGYGRTCYVGTSFVASIRSNRSGTWKRLSTVELSRTPDGLTVMQHRGPGNADPRPEAVEALAALLDAVARRKVPLDREALSPRAERDFRDGIDYSAPGVQRIVLEAWAPYLADGVTDLSEEGLRAHLVGLLDIHVPKSMPRQTHRAA